MRLVIDENGAEQGLLGLQVMGSRPKVRRFERGRISGSFFESL
jgi:hypothetical protein